MRLYSGTSNQFFEDTTFNKIADKLKSTFFEHFHYYPNNAEVASWQNSLRAVSMVFQHANLFDHGIILEYQLPQSSKRLDCLICGRNAKLKDNAVIIELKQWENTRPSRGERELTTWVGGALRDVLHPSVQVGQYKQYLQDYHTAFYEGNSPIILNACSYLHNYPRIPDDEIYADKFRDYLANFPLFTKDDVKILSDFLIGNLSGGDGVEVLRRIEESKLRPGKKLMDHIANVIAGLKDYTLLDEQLVVYDMVKNAVNEGFLNAKKTVIIIEGGPGTGKSVIAMNLMGDLSREHYNAHYVTGSRAFTATLRNILGSRSTLQVKLFNQYGKAEENEVDVIIADEAHRIWPKDLDRFKKAEDRNSAPIVEQLIRASKVSVFFVDNHQIIRPNEVGTSSYIEEHAKTMNTDVLKFKLEAQFRCQGSDAFVNWIDNTLEIEKTANVIWSREEVFDFRIFGSPQELERAILKKAKAGKKARMTAGFCWKWSSPNEDGTLQPDVVIGDFRRPWNAKSDAHGIKLAHGIPEEKLWAYDPNGVDQIGCIYTAQGFEFDYVGVIFGPDLQYNFDRQIWEGHPENSADSPARRSGGNYLTLVKNAYRVLLSRGMEGCYVYFVDKETERFFRSRMERRDDRPAGSELDFP